MMFESHILLALPRAVIIHFLPHHSVLCTAFPERGFSVGSNLRLYTLASSRLSSAV